MWLEGWKDERIDICVGGFWIFWIFYIWICLLMASVLHACLLAFFDDVWLVGTLLQERVRYISTYHWYHNNLPTYLLTYLATCLLCLVIVCLIE